MPCSLGLRLCGGRRGDLGVLALLSCVCGFGRSPVTADKPLALADPPAAFAAVADGNGGFSGTSPNSAGVQPLMGVCSWVVGVLQHSVFVGWEGLFTLQRLLGLSRSLFCRKKGLRTSQNPRFGLWAVMAAVRRRAQRGVRAAGDGRWFGCFLALGW